MILRGIAPIEPSTMLVLPSNTSASMPQSESNAVTHEILTRSLVRSSSFTAYAVYNSPDGSSRRGRLTLLVSHHYAPPRRDERQDLEFGTVDGFILGRERTWNCGASRRPE